MADKQNLKNLILQKEKEGKIVFMTIDGPMSVDLDKFIQQPTEGLLYDLNRDRATVLTSISINNLKWVNDFCVMKVITKLIEYYDERTTRNNLLEKIRYYFELMDAMDTVHLLLSSGTHPKRYGAYRRLSIMVGEMEDELRKII